MVHWQYHHHFAGRNHFRQWEQVGRKVKKGAKALYILGPCTYTKTVTDPDTGEEKKETYVKGFRPISVFAFEATEGSEMDQAEFNPPKRRRPCLKWRRDTASRLPMTLLAAALWSAAGPTAAKSHCRSMARMFGFMNLPMRSTPG